MISASRLPFPLRTLRSSPMRKVLLMFGLIAMNSPLYAADVNDVKQSCWKTSYQDDAGTFVVDARIELKGDSGSYKLEDGQVGQLTNLRYAYITPAPELKVGVYGTWQL